MIERINTRIDALEVSLRDEIRGESSALRVELQTESSSLHTEIREGRAENRRHTEVLHENLRDDIRILADGFALLSTKTTPVSAN
jgi:hypothetical protein